MPVSMIPASPSAGAQEGRPLERIVSRQGASSRFIDTIRINRLQLQQHEGRTYWVKQRRLSSRAIIPCANTFFSLAGNPVVVSSRRSDWQRWEIGSYRLLHEGEGYRAFAGEAQSVWIEELPGIALEAPAKAGSIQPTMLAAAARELRRAHELACPELGGAGWSHGDAHLDNFIYDAASDRARLIDFEVAHRPGMPTADRQTDDLLVMVQSTMGYWPLEQWLEYSRQVIAAYLEGVAAGERRDLLLRLMKRLSPPSGISRIWWAIRTDYIPAAERDQRIDTLRRALSATAGA